MQRYLEPLVNFYPASSDQTRVKALLEHAKHICDKAGLYTNLYQEQGIWNLFAAPYETKHVKVLLQSHIDVVPADDQPFRVDGEAFHGRGTFDMLFAAASYLRFITEHTAQLKDLDFGIFLSGDEELSGEHGVRYFLEQGYTADICILPDAGTHLGVMNIAAKGISVTKIRTNGKAHHGSRPWEGDNATSKLVHLLAEAEELFDHSDHDNSTMTISILRAGEADNQGPKTAEATLDIRYKDKADLKRINAGLTRLLEKYDGEIVNRLEGDDYQLDMGNPLVQSFITEYETSIGKPIETMKAPGSSDARFFSAHNIPVIMLRPKGHGAHGDNEWISITETEQFYQILTTYILKVA